MSALYRKKLLQKQNNYVSSSDESDSDSETEQLASKKIKLDKKQKNTIDEEFDDMNDMFVVDREEAPEAMQTNDIVHAELLSDSHLPPYEMDKDLKEVLDKAIVGPKFENNYQPQSRLLGLNAQARLRRAEREKTKGSDWFHLPATELTDEAKKDLELLRMRNTLDPLAHYRRNDRSVLPKYFQIGKVVDAPEDFYSSRMLKKERKKTMVDEMLYNEASLSKAKKRYAEVRQKEMKKRRGAFQKFGNKKSHKRQAEGKAKNMKKHKKKN